MPYISTNIHPTHCYAYNKYSVTNTHRHVLMFLKCLGVHSCYSFFFLHLPLKIQSLELHYHLQQDDLQIKKATQLVRPQDPYSQTALDYDHLTYSVRISDSAPASLIISSPTPECLESHLYVSCHIFSCSTFAILILCHF